MIALETSVLNGLGEVEARADTFTGVQIDSRRIAFGDLFVAVGGGSEFVDDAVAHGAVATAHEARNVSARADRPGAAGVRLGGR